MSVLYVMIPLAILLALISLIAFIWSIKRGQLDDLDTASTRFLTDDE